MDPAQTLEIVRRRLSPNAAKFCGVYVALWALAALVSAAQGQLLSAVQGRPQDWLATLGYTGAIFSIWEMITPIVLKGLHPLFSKKRGRPLLVGALIAGLPATTILHLALCVQVYWPVYGAAKSSPAANAPLRSTP